MSKQSMSDPTAHPEDAIDESFENAEQGDSNEADANVAILLARLAETVQERDEAKEATLRAVAELQNVRRRGQEQLEQTRKMATEALVRKLLPVLDNFERTLKAIESGATMESLADGVRGVEFQLRAVLDGVKVARIQSVGQAFDPELHDAIAIHDDPELPAHTIFDEIEAGYTMAGQVIRPAKVRVTKGS